MVSEPHIDEIYRCNQCIKEFKLIEINKNWKCPDCSEPISIKVKIGGYLHSCHRLKPLEIKPDYFVTFDNINTHEIIKITQEGDKYRIALGQYGIKIFNKNDTLLVIYGAWI